MQARYLPVVAFGLIAASAIAADPPPSAATLLAEGQAEAVRGHKTIWVIFHASW